MPLAALLGGVLALLGASPALAQEGAGAAASDGILLAELIALLVIGRLLGEAMHRIGQPPIMGQLLAGIVLGPSLLGWLWPDLQHWIFPDAQAQKAMLAGIAQFGVLLLLLLTGMETDLKLVRKVGAPAITVSIAGVAVPFACGLALGFSLPESLLPDPGKRLITALFLGTALSISSIKIVAAIVREMNFTRRNLGQIIVASAIMEDTMGWIIIAITFGLARAGQIDVASVAKSVLGTALFLAASFTFGRRLVFQLIRWANDNFDSDFSVITTILVIMAGMALTTQLIGVTTVLGAFVAGVLIGQSPILTRHIDEQLRGLIMAFFMPVFFGMAGLSADLTILKDPTLLLLALGLIAIASIGKFVGAFVGGEIGGLTRRESLALACGMNARGSTEVIVATIGLSMGALSRNLFSLIVAMAVITTMAMPPMLRWALARVPMSKAEKERLEREEIEARGFVPNLERLLLAVDDSPNGKFTSRLAGLLAGPRGMPITVQPLSGTANRRAGGDARPETEATTGPGGPAKAAADAVKKRPPKEEAPASVNVIVRKADAQAEQAVAREAKKGHDLLFIGVEKLRAKGGAFSRDITGIVGAFDGPIAIVAAKGVHAEDPDKSPLNILVPINGSEGSRRAAEVAITIARVCKAPITVLYVSNPNAGADDDRAWHRRSSRARRNEQAILKDIVELADQYDQRIRTALRGDVAADKAILTEAGKSGRNLIIMGVNRRAGDELFFGDTAASVIDQSPTSVLLVST
jgi:Kef-type K+ transport system membrane component KefB/nucleotide-binding universal stress UspA family protein